VVRMRSLATPDIKRDSRVQMTWFRAPGGCPGLTCRIPIDLNAGQDFTNDEVVTDYFVASAHINAADYPGLTAAWVYLLVDSEFGTEPEYVVDIVDELGTVYATVVVGNLLPYVTAIPLVAFSTLPSGSHDYMPRIRATPGTSFDLIVHYFKIYLDVVSADRIRIPVTLMIAAQGTGGGFGNAIDNNREGYAITNGTTPVYGSTGVNLPIWLWEVAKYADLVSVELETLAAMVWLASAQNPGMSALRNVDTTAIIPSSETTINISLVPTRFMTTLGVDFTAAQKQVQVQYQFQRVPATGQTMRIYRSVLWITLGCFRRGVIWDRTGATCTENAVGFTYDVGGRIFIDSTKYEDPEFFFEGTAGASAIDPNGIMSLYDANGNVTGTAGAVIAASQLTGFPITPLRGRLRSGSFVPDSGEYHLSRVTSGNLFASAVRYLVIELQ
jgi:hypothetical protein